MLASGLAPVAAARELVRVVVDLHQAAPEAEAVGRQRRGPVRPVNGRGTRSLVPPGPLGLSAWPQRDSREPSADDHRRREAERPPRRPRSSAP